MAEMFSLVQVKRHKSGTVEKGVVIKDDLEAAKQSYHAYLGAYAYGHDADIDFVQCNILDSMNTSRISEVWPVTGLPDEEPNEE